MIHRHWKRKQKHQIGLRGQLELPLVTSEGADFHNGEKHSADFPNAPEETDVNVPTGSK